MSNRVFLGLEIVKTLDDTYLWVDELYRLMLLNVSRHLTDNAFQELIIVSDAAIGQATAVSRRLSDNFFIEWSRTGGRFYVCKHP